MVNSTAAIIEEKRMIYLYPYSMASESAKALALAMNIKRIKTEGSKYKHKPGNWIINWGSSNIFAERTINPGEAVALLINKRSFFNLIKDIEGVNVIPFTQDIEVAKGWDATVVERHTLTGNSGKGIKIKERGEGLEQAPLYTKYIPKDTEWRIHMVGDRVVDIQRKGIKQGTVPTTWKIRSHNNGFIFLRSQEAPGIVLTQVEKVHNFFREKGLTFAAYDVILNDRSNKAYVLEGNTAPGLEGTTVQKYADALKEHLNELHV